MAIDNQNWKNKFQDLMHTCQTELKKTTQIGIKLVSATQSNSALHAKFEELGKLTREALASGELKWVDERVKDLVEEINQLESELKTYEEDVQKIKTKES